MEYKIINGAVTYQQNTVLEEINFEIKDKDKIAIVGRNGCGKTTLLKSLINNELLETGLANENLKIIKIGNPTIGYQQQNTFSNLNITLIDEILKNYKQLINMEKKIKYLEEQLKTDDAIKFIDEYTTMLEKYKLNGGYEYKKEYELALLKFGFSNEDKYKKLEEFSGGQRTKLAFLKLLLSKPDILLLDEPTNHLDITTVEWLEDYLKNYPKAVVIVSHDRMFLDNIVNKVYEIEYGMLTKYKGNYSSFEKQKKANYEKQLKDYEYQQKEIKRLKSIADRFRYKPSKASMAMSKLRKIEQMDIIDKPQKFDSKTFKTELKIEKSSDIVLSVKDLEFGFDGNCLGKTNFELHKGQKLAIIGSNGKGKSTLLKTIMELIPKISGSFKYGYNVKKEYFDQQLEFINEENTVYEEYEQSFPDCNTLQIRKILGTFQFINDDIYKKINQLSGGEKVRLRLCKIFKHNPNLLILDEPTNHLDIIGKESLENILTLYEGAILFVSHDRYFVNKIADSLLIFEDDNIKFFNGNYKDYMDYKNNEIKTEVKVKTNVKTKGDVTRNIKAINRKLEKEIENLEKSISIVNNKMLQEEFYSDYKKMNELQKELENLNASLEEKYLEWEEINS
ncbi:MAG TPA: ABC-F family ATP-binding cassette domain-containing protein [Bacilli bacterium]|nr:ABC-F family ATP-binding cassette domain-containing protein [Bacilli bacterium]